MGQPIINYPPAGASIPLPGPVEANGTCSAALDPKACILRWVNGGLLTGPVTIITAGPSVWRASFAITPPQTGPAIMTIADVNGQTTSEEIMIAAAG